MISAVFFAAICFVLIYFGHRFLCGQTLSIASITAITAIIYFVYFPLSLEFSGNEEFLGYYLKDTDLIRWAVILYLLGAFCALWRYRRWLIPFQYDYQQSIVSTQHSLLFWILTFLAATNALVMLAGGFIQFGNSNNDNLIGADFNFRFLLLFFDLMIPLGVYQVARSGFRPQSIAIIIFISFLFLAIGFRYRLLILVGSLLLLYYLRNNKSINLLTTLIAVFGGFILMIIIGMTRSYNQGIDLSRLYGIDLSAFIFNVGGESGILFALDNVLRLDDIDYIFFDPWIIGVTRLIPSFIWPGKPEPYYLEYFILGFGPGANQAGVAPPQVAEIFLQFGWVSIPVMAYLYFLFICLVMKHARQKGGNIALTVFSISPFFFGYYMQSRGYFFQMFSSFLFMIFPVFFVEKKLHRV